MILKLQTLIGKSVQSSHLINAEKSVWHIGQTRHADIYLEGDRVAQSHATLNFENEHWQIKAEQGRLKIAGNFVDSADIDDGLIVSIGPYLLKFSFSDSRSAVLDDPNQPECQDHVLEVKDPRITSSRFKPKIDLGRLKDLSLKAGSKRKNSNPVANQSVKKRRLILILLVIIVWSFVVLKSCQPDNQQTNTQATDSSNSEVSEVVSNDKETPQVSLNEKRIANRYIQWSQQLYQQGEFEQAYLRLQAGHLKIPTHSGLESALTDLRNELIELYRTSGDFEKALKILEPVKNANDDYASLYEHLYSQQKLSRKISENVAVVSQRVSQITPQIQELVSGNRFDRARQIMATIDIVIVNADRVLKQQYEGMLEFIDQAQQVYLDKLQKKQASQQAIIENNQTVFYDCLDYIESGDFKSAYDICNKVDGNLAGNLDMTEVKIWLEYLEQTRDADSRLLLQKAERCYKDGSFKCAFDAWERALADAGNDVAVDKNFKQALDKQIVVAQNLFKTAKAYEDLGQIEQAKSELRELMVQLPLINQPLYRKAKELLELLEQY